MANPSPDEGVRAALEAAERIVVEAIKRMRAAHVQCLDLTNDAEAFLRQRAALSTPVPEEGRTEMAGGDVIACVDPERWDHTGAPQLAYANGWNDALAGLPRGSASAAEQPALVSAQDDPVRRAAYQQAMSRLANRVGLSDRFTASMRPELRQYDGPELIGSHELLPKTGSGAASALPSPLPSQGEPVADDPLEAATYAAALSGLPRGSASAAEGDDLREVLRQFALVADEYEDDKPDGHPVWADARSEPRLRKMLTLGLFRAARTMFYEARLGQEDESWQAARSLAVVVRMLCRKQDKNSDAYRIAQHMLRKYGLEGQPLRSLHEEGAR